MIRIHLCGAAGEVTGSGYLVETEQARVLVDFGMFQGWGSSEARNRDLGPVEPASLDAVVLTHAHLDHCGRLPLLARGAAGAAWKLFGTAATLDLTWVVLEDSARIQEADAAHAARHAEPGSVPEPPLYEREDVEALMPRAVALAYGAWREVAAGVRVRLRDAGHILGSASVEMDVRDGGRQRRIVFSGDVGPRGAPLVRDPDPPTEAELVFCESTYGHRDHRPRAETEAEFRDLIRDAAWQRTKVLVPSFAVGRTQVILWELAAIFRNGAVPRVPIYLDSPMAVRAGEVHRRHQAILDEEAGRMVRSGALAEDLSELRILATTAESRTLNDSWDPCIVVAASGMCDGGRIMHHLLHNLWKKGVKVILTGYMGQGTLGRRLLDGDREVRIMGQRVEVRAEVHGLGGFSAHADQSGLLWWLSHLLPPANARRGPGPRVVLIHGEDMQRTALAGRIAERFGVDAERPGRGAVVELP
ncbi:MAG: MBL fold metallo-hydrolase [Phycisphaerales bacterium]